MRDNFSSYPSKRIWGLSRPDTNIDHRRVPNLQVLFRRHGTELPVTQQAEDYMPGAIVSLNYSHGVISAEAFERRLDVASDATSIQELIDVVADLSLQPDNQYQQQRERSFTPRYQAGDDTCNENIICVLSSNQHSGQWLVPAEIRIVSILGSVELDFSEAIFQHQNIFIRVNNWIGSLTILVPEQVNVVSNMFNIIGSTDNRAPCIGDRQAPQIVVDGYSILGSLDVRLKKTMKEKFTAFADQCRAMFGLSKS